MNWEESIKLIRSDEKYRELIRLTYISEDLEHNITMFRESEEFQETMQKIRDIGSTVRTVLELGCGNGIAAINFALEGYNVTATDPDESKTVGTGAVEIMKEKLGLHDLNIINSTAEELDLPSGSFDLIYCRQAMHHARDLNIFVANAARLLKTGGLMLTVRDHVIYNKKDKQWFLDTHPLHHMYGGENAYLATEYKEAFKRAGLEIIQELKYFDSVINFYPLSKAEFSGIVEMERNRIRKKLEDKLGGFGKCRISYFLYRKLKFDPKKLIDEAGIAGRMYSYILKKN